MSDLGRSGKNAYSSSTLVGNFSEERFSSQYRPEHHVRLPVSSSSVESTYAATIAAAGQRRLQESPTARPTLLETGSFPGHQFAPNGFVESDRLVSESRRAYLPPASQAEIAASSAAIAASNPRQIQRDREIQQIRQRWSHLDDFTKSLYVKKV
eukprot:ANDGO_01826.mRNA.1 hypothetical protein